MSEPLLKIIDLSIKTGSKTLVDSITLTIEQGKILGILGESGSGKTITALSILGLLPKGVNITEGAINLYQEKSLVNLANFSEKEFYTIRGSKISMIFQEPMTSLNPSMRCGAQTMESLIKKNNLSRSASKEQVLKLFKEVKLPDVDRIFKAWPHQLSGGQRQRVMIAMALATRPELLIADEPTTALDVTVQKGILELLLELRAKYNLSILFITHDLLVLNQIADQIAVMYKGKIVESGNKDAILHNPQTPYSKGLLACKPKLNQKPGRLLTVADFLNETGDKQKSIIKKTKNQRDEIILSVQHLEVSFKSKKQNVQAVNEVSFDVFKGETLGLVGESGCGKTTLGRSILQLIDSYSGSIKYRGEPLNTMRASKLRSVRKSIQIVFQDPYSSLNPSKSVGSILSEPLIVHKIVRGKFEIEKEVIKLLSQVGLDADSINLYPHQFSGGQRQRIGIARALACRPEFIVLDESVSALDVSVQAQILNLLNDLKEQLELTYIFISHDLTVVKYMSDRMMVMSNGEIIESGDSEGIFNNPQHSYTKNLINSIPV